MKSFLKRNTPVFIVGLITLFIFVGIIIASQNKKTLGPELQKINNSELIAPHTYVRGNPDAPITLVMFCNFYETECSEYYKYVDGLYQQYRNYLKVAFRHYAPEDKLASTAAQVAGEQNKFWELVKLLFENMQEDKNIETITIYAKNLNFDIQKFQDDLNNGDYESLIDTDTQFAKSVGVEKVPFFFLNGQRMEFKDTLDFRDQVESRVKEYIPQANVSSEPTTEIVYRVNTEPGITPESPEQRLTDYMKERSKETLEIVFTNSGWDPQLATGYPGQLVKWTNQTAQVVRLAQLDAKFPEFSDGVEIEPGESFEFRLYKDRRWRYMDSNTSKWAEIFIMY